MKASGVYLLIFFTYSTAYAQSFQEVIFDTKHQNSCYGVARVGDNVYFTLDESMNYFSYSPVSSSLLIKADENLNPLDTFDIDSAIPDPAIRVINSLQKLSDSTIGVFCRSLNGAYYSVILDTNFVVIEHYSTYISQNEGIYTVESSYYNDSIFVIAGGMGVNRQMKPFYYVFDRFSGNPIVTVVVDSVCPNNPCLFTDMIKTTGYYYLTFNQGSSTKIIALDNSFNLVSSLNRSQVSNLPNSTDHKIYALNDSLIIAFGTPGGYYFSRTVYNDSLSIISMDTLATDDHVVVGNENFPKYNNNSYYMVASRDPVLYEWQLTPGLKTDIMVYHLNRQGQIKWYREIGDSNYFFTLRTLTSSDGGLFIFSIKYDADTYDSTKTSLSIIKLDSTGAIVDMSLSEKFFNLIPISNKISCFPNPTSGKLTIQGLPEKEAVSAHIYDLQGQLLFTLPMGKARDLEVDRLPSTTYLILFKAVDSKILGQIRFTKI